MFSRLIQEEFSDSLKTNLLQGAYLEEPLFGPNGRLPKVSHERRLPEAQFDQKNPKIPVEPLKGIYPEGQGVTTNSKAKTEIAAPDPQEPVDVPASTDIENLNVETISDTLKMESVKIVPDSLSKNNVGNGNLPESVDPDTKNSGIEK